MEDRTERVRQVVERYATTSPSFEFDFIPLRLEDAFDLEWWKRVGGGSLASSAQSLGMDMTNESKSLYSFVLPSFLFKNLQTFFSPHSHHRPQYSLYKPTYHPSPPKLRSIALLKFSCAFFCCTQQLHGGRLMSYWEPL